MDLCLYNILFGVMMPLSISHILKFFIILMLSVHCVVHAVWRKACIYDCSFVGGGILPHSTCNLKGLGTGTEYIQTKLMICLLYYCPFCEDSEVRIVSP